MAVKASERRVDVGQDVLDKLEIRLEHIRELPPIVPLVVSYGCGVDSTALLIYMKQVGVCPDRIQFADTGNELPETYAYLPIINGWLRKAGFPEVTVVKKRSKHKSLGHNMLDNNTLPGLAFGYGTCALKWKVDPMNYDLTHWYRSKQCLKAGYKIVKAIGYDASCRDTERFCDSFDEMAKKRERAEAGEDVKIDDRFVYWYPLIEAGIDRETCKAIIRDAGLPVPIKSACNFCPARKGFELVQLAETHPQLADEAVKMEQMAVRGVHGLRSTKGLGRNFTWEKFFKDRGYNFGYSSEEEFQKDFQASGAYQRHVVGASS